MGNPFGSLWNDARQAVGAGISDGAHALGDGLNAVGLHGAAQAVDTLGDKAGYDLGADVPELQLGQTADPAELVHGDPAAIRSSASRLRTFSSAFGETASGLRGLDTAHWTGSAADAFRAKFAPQPAKWQDASSANGTAAGALESYAGAVETAQNGARQAIDLYAQGEQATAAAQAAYNQQVAAYNSAAQAYNAQLASGQHPGTPPTEPGPFTDPGEAMRQQAQQILSEARSARDAAAASAAGAIRPAADLAPAEPSFLSQLGHDFSDALQVNSLASASFGGGVVDGAANIVKFARSIDPENPWNTEHPAEYAAGLSGTAAGLTSDVINPEGLMKGLVGTGWAGDPFQAAGRLVPNVALAVGTDGAGPAADAGSVAESAAVASGESAVAGAGSAAARASGGGRGQRSRPCGDGIRGGRRRPRAGSGHQRSGPGGGAEGRRSDRERPDRRRYRRRDPGPDRRRAARDAAAGGRTAAPVLLAGGTLVRPIMDVDLRPAPAGRRPPGDRRVRRRAGTGLAPAGGQRPGGRDGVAGGGGRPTGRR